MITRKVLLNPTITPNYMQRKNISYSRTNFTVYNHFSQNFPYNTKLSSTVLNKSPHLYTPIRSYLSKWLKRLSRILESKYYPPPPKFNPNSFEVYSKSPDGSFISSTVQAPSNSNVSSPNNATTVDPTSSIMDPNFINLEHNDKKSKSNEFQNNSTNLIPLKTSSIIEPPTMKSHPLFPPRLAFVPPKPIFSSELKPLKPIWRSRRVGLLAYKLGCIGVWNEWGERICLTVCQVDRCSVIEVKTVPTHGYEAVVFGCGYKPLSNQSKPNIGRFMKAKTGPKHHIAEFKCTSDALLPIGHEMSVRHFVPGQWLFVSSWTKAKGFMGVMKRWGFAGGNKSHGTEHKAHSAAGSISQGKSVNIVWKYKKMAGHHGPDPRVVNSKLFRIDTERNLLFLTGAIPGKQGSLIKIFDARGKTCARNKDIKLPFPTFVPVLDKESYPTIVQCPASKVDPFALPDVPVYDYKS